MAILGERLPVLSAHGVQHRLRTLLLALVVRVESNLIGARAPGGRRHAAEASHVELVEIFVHFYARGLRAVLRDVGHLLLLR